MRPTLAIIPLALLLAWFGPSPSGEVEASASSDVSREEARQPTEASASDQLAQAWASIQRGDLLQATAEVAPRR